MLQDPRVNRRPLLGHHRRAKTSQPFPIDLDLGQRVGLDQRTQHAGKVNRVARPKKPTIPARFDEIDCTSRIRGDYRHTGIKSFQHSEGKRLV